MSKVHEDQRITFVTGKGGVGKSTLAAAIALKLSMESESPALLVELGDSSYFEVLFEAGGIGYRPRSMRGNLDFALWSPENCLQDYVLHFLKIEKVVDLFFKNPVMKALINVAPGLAEVTLLGKATSGIRGVGSDLPYRHIVIDSPSTGHALALLRAPKALSEVFRIGPMGRESRRIHEVLIDSSKCSYVIVALPQELPRVETLELFHQIREEFGVVPKVYCNKILSPPLSESELEGILQTQTKGGISHFAKYLLDQLKREREHIDIMKAEVGWVGEVPLVLDSEPWKLIETLGEYVEPH